MRGRSRVATFVVTMLALAAVPAVASAAGAPLPKQGNAPMGANDFSCKPSARHPYPVVLVHGTFANMAISWNLITPTLRRLGYCVFALDYGNSPIPGINAVGDIPTSARQLETFVDRVLAATHARKVSIVGHSQGGMMPRYLIKFLGFSTKVDDLVGLSPSNHGTTNVAAKPGGLAGCPACAQQAAGSPFITNLNAGDDTPGTASYTVVETRNDEVVTPFQSEFLTAGPQVTNVLLQKTCPQDGVDHVGIIYDPPAVQWMLNALGRPGPADPGFRPDCSGTRALQTYPDTISVARPTLRITAVRKLSRHRLAVRVRPSGGRVRSVRVELRRGARRLARSRAVTVTGSRRLVLVSRRALTRGRYTLTARGADGFRRSVAARRRVARLR